jgi:two-component sensor histidine kinase
LPLSLTLPDIASAEPKCDKAVALQSLIETILAPYITEDRSSVITSGPEVQTSGKAAIGMSLVLHEMATNAAKYGALSSESGHVEVSWRVSNGELLLTWRERGGPAINPQPEKEEFGSLLTRWTVAGQLAGNIFYDWKPEGLTVNLSAPLVNLME